jgi:outer membrane protein W
MRGAALRTALLVGLLGLTLPALAATPRHYPRGGPSAASEGFSLGLRFGLYNPEGDSDLFDQVFTDFTGEVEDLEDGIFGVDFAYALHPNSRVVVSFASFEGDTVHGYRDAEFDPFLEGVLHETQLRVSPLTLGFQIFPGSLDSRFRPFVGAGGGFYGWRYREIGEFVLFAADPADDEIISATFEDDGITFGYYLQAGLELLVTPNWALVVEARWHEADDDLSEEFAQTGATEIDLSGREVSAGFSVKF